MAIVVREMREQDMKGVQKVAKKSWEATYDGIIPQHIQERFLASAYSDQTMRERLDQTHLFVAEDDDKIVGFANFSPVKNGATELGAIYIYPEYQGIGIGTALLNYGINQCDGVKEVSIYVEKNNHNGLNFYQAKGFVKVSEFNDDLFGHEVKTIQMKLIVQEAEWDK